MDLETGLECEFKLEDELNEQTEDREEEEKDRRESVEDESLGRRGLSHTDGDGESWIEFIGEISGLFDPINMYAITGDAG